MRKSIKNYSTAVSPNKTILEIQILLAAKGAEKIMIDYRNCKPVGITFLLKTANVDMPIKLPARIENLERVFEGLVPKGKEKEQAERTGWRNIKDWIDAQIALIETEMVSMEEVFFPYLITEENSTLFERYQSGVLQLNAPKEHELRTKEPLSSNNHSIDL